MEGYEKTAENCLNFRFVLRFIASIEVNVRTGMEGTHSFSLWRNQNL